MSNRPGVRITGGMSPTFISTIARSANSNRIMKETAEGVKNRLEAKAKARTKGRGRFRYHYGMRKKNGSYGWGQTYVIWASTPVAKANVRWFRTAISSARAVFRKK